MYLSKSKYCCGVQCKKKLWLETYKSEVKDESDNESVLDNGTRVGELAKGLFGKYKDVEFNENLSKMIDDTNEYLKEEKVTITEASFNYNGNFCSVDILKKNGNTYEMYEVKSSTEVSDIYLDDASYQYYVLTKLGFDVKKCSIVHINSNYVRIGELELDRLFVIEDVTDIAISKLKYVEYNINDFN